MFLLHTLSEAQLKDGSISWNDYERTKRFAAVNRTYWPVCHFRDFRQSSYSQRL